MQLPKETLDAENEYLKKCTSEIRSAVDTLETELDVRKTNIIEDKKFAWDNKSGLDKMEIVSNTMQAEQDFINREKNAKYLKKLYCLKNSPYFGRVDFNDETNKEHIVYIGITHLSKDYSNMIYDWRAPISSLFYDHEVGNAFYYAPEGKITGDLKNKRQYKIKGENIINIFDNSVNVTDELLQEVLTNTSSDKMKNIVNTIQKEQNEVIRNTSNKYLIVQGIAGSGKTSVALHRIAFLLYKIENLASDNILIFSPNNIFSEYISNVLPELGEANAKETTFSDLATNYITKYKKIESFASFIERYYTKGNKNVELTRFKMSDEIIRIVDEYVDLLVKKARFTVPVAVDLIEYGTSELNSLFHVRYSKMTIFERIELMAEHLCNIENKSVGKYSRSVIKRLWESITVNRDIKELYRNLFKSLSFTKAYGMELSDDEINNFIEVKELAYDDCLLYIYLQGKLQSFPYSSVIKQIIIDEAQDYSRLQYVILKTIFPRASYTILGDVNQNINPYYKYNSLYDLSDIFEGVFYYELNKTYRSSPEIIDYSNAILGLEHAVSIRKSNDYKVELATEKDLLKELTIDITNAKKQFQKIAVITKSNEEANKIYEMLKDKFEDISYLSERSKEFNRDLVIIPSYLSKGLEFDCVIAYTERSNKYNDKEKNLFYVVTTRAQHQLKVYNQ